MVVQVDFLPFFMQFIPQKNVLYETVVIINDPYYYQDCRLQLQTP